MLSVSSNAPVMFDAAANEPARQVARQHTRDCVDEQRRCYLELQVGSCDSPRYSRNTAYLSVHGSSSVPRR